MNILTDRYDYFANWFIQVEESISVTGHIRVLIRGDGHGVYVANTLRQMGYHVKLFRSTNWFSQTWIEVKKNTTP